MYFLVGVCVFNRLHWLYCSSRDARFRLLYRLTLRAVSVPQYSHRYRKLLDMHLFYVQTALSIVRLFNEQKHVVASHVKCVTLYQF